jgi:hypothetical protein
LINRARWPSRFVGWILVAGLLASGICAAETWYGRVQGGPEVMVDPDTRRAVGVIDGQQRPLWDGVHRLEDGSSVIIRDGIAVPTEPMFERWEGVAKPEPIYASRYCNQLVRKTCGFDNACNTAGACLRARTLLGEEAREQRQLTDAGFGYPQTAASECCRDALEDPEFPACATLAGSTGNSRCRDLVERVCGKDSACDDSQACDAARQLQAMETQERLTNADPSALSLTGRQCLEAMSNAFFEPCAQR